MSAISPNQKSTDVYPQPELVKKMFVDAQLKDVKANLPFVLQAMAKRDMTSSRQLIGVLATIAVEVAPFRPIEEYGKGNGKHKQFYGRGYIQLTHDYNYAAYKAYSGIDVVNKPELVLKPEIAADSTIWYWCGGAKNDDIRPYAEKADWKNVRSIVNAGKPGRFHKCWGVKKYLNAVRLGIANLTDGLDKELIGSLPGGYGLGSADGGSGSDRNFMGLNPNSPGDAIAMALNIQGSFNWRTHEFRAQFNVPAFEDLLKLRPQKKFKLTGFGDNLDEDYKVESVLITGGNTLEMEVVANKKDPNAPDPLVFRQDSGGSLVDDDVTNIDPSLGGDIPSRLHAAAKANFGKSTAAGPDGGNQACAWAFGKYCALPAGLEKFGSGTYGSNAVAGVLKALKNGRGTKISRSQATAGDVWADAPAGNRHIGIVWEADSNGAKTILSNSSSKAAFKWVGSVESVQGYYSGQSQFWRVTE